MSKNTKCCVWWFGVECDEANILYIQNIYLEYINLVK